MDWTAEPVPAASIPPSAPSGSRPPLPKLRVKLGGVQLSGGSSQRANGSPNAADLNLPGVVPALRKLLDWLAGLQSATNAICCWSHISQKEQHVGSQARL